MRSIAVVAVLLGGCNNILGIGEFTTSGDDGDDDAPIDSGPPDVMPPPELAARYVVSQVTIPADSTQSMMLGRDLDGDGTVDNQLGMIFAALDSQDLLIVYQANAAIQSGDAIWLHELYAYDLGESSRAIWASYDGEPESTPDFSGNGVFAVDGSYPTSGRIEGAIAGSAYLGQGGEGRMVLGVGTGVVHLSLRAAAATVNVSDTGCTGSIAGGIPDEEVQNNMIPGMHTATVRIVTDDPGCPSSCGETATAVLGLFDADSDGTITLEEFRMTPLIMALFVSDLDLDGDGEAEALSAGVGVTCVRGSFATP